MKKMTAETKEAKNKMFRVESVDEDSVVLVP
jgi:hypothetical protein